MGSNVVQGVPDVIAALRGQPCRLVEDEEAVILVQHTGLQLTGDGGALGVKLPTCTQAQAFVTFLVAAASSAAPAQSVAAWGRVVLRRVQAKGHPAGVTCSCMQCLERPEKVKTASFMCSLSRRACSTSHVRSTCPCLTLYHAVTSSGPGAFAHVCGILHLLWHKQLHAHCQQACSGHASHGAICWAELLDLPSTEEAVQQADGNRRPLASEPL